MSTTFKIIENHIQNSKVSPKKSLVLTSSQHLSPSSRAHDSDDDNQSLDKQQVLKLQIKQLQRQNKFLKKKINELTAQLNGDHQIPKKKAISGKGAPKQDIDPTHLSVDFFFKEINNLMNSLADLFKVQFTNEEVKEFSNRFVNIQQSTSNRKYIIFKKFILTRKLQKITLQSQQKRYPMLLEVFSSYYKAKQECDKYVRQVVDDLSARVLQLNKMILNNASKKKSSMKGSSIRSTYTFDEGNLQKILDSDYQLGSPWTLRRIAPPSSFTYTNDNIRKKLDNQSQKKD